MTRDLLNDLPAALVSIVSEVGLAKVASVLTGTDVASEYDTYARLGADIFMRRKEAALIQRGLVALNALGERR